MHEDDRTRALALFNSMRGKYIISQALCLAVKEINSRELHRQEPSNVADMEFLITNLFPIYRVVEAAEVALASKPESSIDLETKKVMSGLQDEVLGDLIKKAVEHENAD